MKNKISLRTPVIQKMALLKKRTDSFDLNKRDQVIEAILTAFGKWQPGDDWVPSDEELRFILDLRKQHPDIWKRVTGHSAVDWVDLNTPIDDPYASVEY